MRRLVIAPHMDDESLGCGGLLAKYAAQCRLVAVADSGPVRAAEHARALDLLGVTDSVALGLPDTALGQDMPRLVRELDRQFGEFRPDEVYLPYPSLHQDHIAVYEAGMRASRASMSSSHWFPPTVLVYDIAAYDLNLYPTDLRWNVFEALTAEQAELKRRACAAYESESPGGAHPMNSVKDIARAVGNMRLTEFAEQYALVRLVRS